MAEDKASFVLYRDQRGVFEKLNNEQAGTLIKHIFSYVNDEDPEADFVTELAFESIKQQLKRDLKRWESTIEGRSKAGKASAEARKLKKEQTLTNPTNPTNVKFVQQTLTNPTVTVNDTVNVNVNDNVIKKKNAIAFSFTKELISLGVGDQIVKDWLKVRRKKKATDSITSLNAIKKQIEMSGKSANECIKICVEKDWKGFSAEWIQEAKKPNTLEVAGKNAMEAIEILRQRELNK